MDSGAKRIAIMCGALNRETFHNQLIENWVLRCFQWNSLTILLFAEPFTQRWMG